MQHRSNTISRLSLEFGKFPKCELSPERSVLCLMGVLSCFGGCCGLRWGMGSCQGTLSYRQILHGYGREFLQTIVRYKVLSPQLLGLITHSKLPLSATIQATLAIQLYTLHTSYVSCTHSTLTLSAVHTSQTSSVSCTLSTLALSVVHTSRTNSVSCAH